MTVTGCSLVVLGPRGAPALKLIFCIFLVAVLVTEFPKGENLVGTSEILKGSADGLCSINI